MRPRSRHQAAHERRFASGGATTAGKRQQVGAGAEEGDDLAREQRSGDEDVVLVIV
ncbi:MAG: hypothetical protein QOD83_3929 [Solirubrobacteraceae bacterium]|nr:hypothetical protein [Solirubrobacteraceae bacterium]